MDNTKNFNLKKPSAEDWYNIQDHNDNMDIVDAELKKLNDGKAPSGHGLGELTKTYTSNFIDMVSKGCGFYTVVGASDSPTGTTNWLNLIQVSKGYIEGDHKETAVQIVPDVLSGGSQDLWYRMLFDGTVYNWKKIIHTGNIGKYADAKFACGTYTGALSGAGSGSTGDPFYRSKTLPLPFKADYIDIICVDDYTWRINIARNVNKAILMWQNFSVNQSTSVKWSGNNVTWGNSIPSNETGNLAVMNNAGYTYAWFAYGKGEGA